MKRIKVALLILPLALTGCNKKNPNAIYVMNNYDSIAEAWDGVGVDITANEFIDKLDSKQTFPLLFYSNECSHCTNVKEILKVFNRDSHVVFYQLEYKDTEYELLINKEVERIVLVCTTGEGMCMTANRYKLPSIFTDDVYTPRIMLFNEGTLSYEINSNKMSSKKALIPLLESLFKDSNLSMAFSKSGLLNYNNSHNSYLAFVYDSTNKLSNELFGQYIMNKGLSNQNNALIIDKKNIKSECFNYFCTNFGFNQEDSSYIYLYQNGEKIKTINYALDDGLIAKEFIADYFQQS